MTLSGTGCDLALTKVCQQLSVIELAIIFIYLRYFLFQFLLISLRKTSHDKQLPYSPFFLGFDEF